MAKPYSWVDHIVMAQCEIIGKKTGLRDDFVATIVRHMYQLMIDELRIHNKFRFFGLAKMKIVKEKKKKKKKQGKVMVPGIKIRMRVGSFFKKEVLGADILHEVFQTDSEG